jgi:iron complex outermembrane recepter protein
MTSTTPPRARLLLPAFRPRIAAASLSIAACCCAGASPSFAQSQLPPLKVETKQPKAASPKSATKAAGKTSPAPQPVPSPAPAAPASAPSASLTAPTTAEAQAQLARVPGSVVVVPDAAYKNSTPATTLKDILDYVPGVFVQPKWGEDSRLSIRGSGLSRNFHLRGVQLYMDGIPINTADGYGDFQEIDPSAYRYVEVYKGANALRYGANSLGGAINFVTPTGRDAAPVGASADIGSFGFHRLQSTSGGVSGPWDFFVTGAWQEADGFRQHSDGESVRASANLGYRLSPDVETRFYLNANDIQQRIPGSVTRGVALSSPTTAAANNVLNDHQRNIESWRIANKTAFRLAPGTILEVGGFVVDRHLMHPIFQWLDYRYADYGGFIRIYDERIIGGFKNRLIAGANLHNGELDNRQYDNLKGAVKGNLKSSSLDTSENLSAYVENSFYFLPTVALVTGTQFIHATRDREDRIHDNNDTSGRTDFDIWSPKIGLLWEVDPSWQVFANISRSAEVPSFGEGSNMVMIPFDQIKEQRALTYEVGTRGRRPDYTWDLAVYRAEIRNELMCRGSGQSTGSCTVVNLDRTVHQGVEIGFGAAVLKSMLVGGPSPDRLWLNLAYTFNDFYFDNDKNFGNNELPGAPRHFVRTELLYKHPSGTFFGPNIEWVPQAYYVDSANTVKTEAYLIWGLKAGFDDGGPLSAHVEARNLSDEAYIASVSIIDVANANSALFEPGTGRAVYAGVRYRW